ncbi:hypothetical protein ACFSHQ_27610 [Gemmobacter lanyuensis]
MTAPPGRMACARWTPAPPPAADRAFGGGWKNNGITTSLLNLLGACRSRSRPASGDRGAQPEALANLARLDPRIRVIHRETFPMRATEAAALRRFQTDNDLSDPVLETQIRALFTREARRLLAGGYSMPRWISAAIRGNGRR